MYHAAIRLFDRTHVLYCVVLQRHVWRICACVCVVVVGGADGCIPLMSVLSFAYVRMLTAFRDTFLVVKLGE